MSGSSIAFASVREVVFALPAMHWIALVKDDEGTSCIHCRYTRAQLLNSVRYFRHRNANGCHVYARPDAPRYILVDDLCEDALDQLKADGLRPNVVVLTSPYNYQAWIDIGDNDDVNISRKVSHYLASKYDGDLRSAKPAQLGRLPGFTNQKEMYYDGRYYPFTKLARPVYRGVAPGIADLLTKAAAHRMPEPSLSSSTLRGSVLIGEGWEAMYQDAAGFLFKRFGNAQFQDDRSRLDFAVAQHLIKNEVIPDDCVSILLAGSEKAKERGAAYAQKTVQAALSK